MSNWNNIFAEEMFWVLYFRLFLKSANYGFVWENEVFSDFLKKFYGGQGVEQKIILRYRQNYELQIVFSGDPDRGNTDAFYLLHPSFPERRYLGEDSPHFALPIFRLEEFETLVAAAAVDFDRKYVPLLLLKTIWITQNDDVSALQHKAAAFFEGAGVFGSKVAELLAVLLPTNSTIAWEHDEQYGWVNNGEYSRRKKNDINRKISDFLKVA